MSTRIARVIGLIAAALFVASLLFTQGQCPIPVCKGQDIDAWLLPAALAPVGIPTLIWSILFLLRRLRDGDGAG